MAHRVSADVILEVLRALQPALDRIGEDTDAGHLDLYTVTTNLAGITGISLPAGFDSSAGKERPIGMQLIAKAFDENTLLRVARGFEKATDFHQRLPDLDV